MSNSSAPSADIPEKLAFTFDEVCHELGCGRTTVHHLIAQGKLPARKLNSRVLVLRDDLAAFLSTLPSKRAA